MSSEPKESDVSAVFRAVDAEQGGAERRRHPRYPCSVPVFVRVLVEEETFDPLRFPGNACNISVGGMMLTVEGLSENDYRMLIRRQRMARVHAQIPDAGGEVVFFGKIVWYDYRQSSRGPSCRLGISFDVIREREQQILDDLLRRLEEVSRTPPPSGP